MYLHRDAVDFHKSINGLSVLVKQLMKLDPSGRAVYGFRNRRVDRIKLLLYERNGFWLLMKRLEADRFSWTRCASTPSGAMGGSELSRYHDAIVIVTKRNKGNADQVHRPRDPADINRWI
ncbi:MAG: IS66 family insertion sequence element accessory protein TnpB [Burkholderia sp.]